MQSNKDKNLIVELSFVFALKIIKYVELLVQGRKYVIARQLIRSGTSIGANEEKQKMLKAVQILFIN